MKKISLILLISILSLFLSGCNLPFYLDAQAQPASSNGVYRLATPDPNATTTPTPFLPSAPTPILLDPENIALEPSPTPTVKGSKQTATPTPAVTKTPVLAGERPDGLVTILLLGSDYRPNAGFRTDVIILVFLNPKKGTVSLVSFPRDLYVNIPGWMMQRINTSQMFGGFPTTQLTFQENFNIRPDYYIMTNFNGFKGMIDTLGGVTIYASKNLTDRCDLPQGVGKYCSVGPGSLHMDGDTALWYIRSRYSSNDFDRERRAQEVLQGIFLKLMSLNAVTRAPDLFKQFSSSVETDLTITQILPLLPLAAQVGDTNQVKRYSIGPGQVVDFVTPEGAMVLIPDKNAIWQIILQAMNPS